MDEQLKNLLRELKEELDRFDFQKTRFDDQMKKFDDGMKQDIADGLYKNTPEDKLQKLIEDEKNKIREKYNNQNNELSDENREKLEESVYKQISSAIKDYHLDMVLEVNKANKVLTNIEAERNFKLQEMDKKIEEKEKEKQEKINEIDKKISQIEAKQVHLMYYNSKNQSDAERDMQALAFVQEINELKFQRDSISNEEIDLLKQERDNTEEKYNNELKEQSDMVKHYSQQKERAAKFLGSVILSEKSIDEIQEILFEKEQEQEQENEQNEQDVENNEVAENNEQPENENKPNSENAQTAEVETIENSSPENENRQSPATSERNATSTHANNTTNNSTPNSQGQNVENNKNEENKKFLYKFSIKKGIEFDGKRLDVEKLLIWHEQNQEDIEAVIEKTLEGKKDIAEFIQSGDKLIYLSIMIKDLTETKNPIIQLTEQAKERLEEYYNVWANPISQEESNMNIEYDLRGTSRIARFFRRTSLTQQDINNIKENAFETRNRKNVSIDKLTNIEFKIKELFQKIKSDKETKGLKAGEETRENNSNKESNSTRGPQIFRNAMKIISRTKSAESQTTVANQPVNQQENEPITPNQSNDAR